MRVITLDSSDDFVSIRDQLVYAKTVRAALVVPEVGGPHLSTTDLALLRRLAERERMRIGLVTPDSRLRRLAHDLGLPAFRSVSAARRDAGWRVQPRQGLGMFPVTAKTRSRPKRLWTFIVLLAGFALLVITLLALPQAIITLGTAPNLPAVTLAVRVDSSATQPDAAAMSIPGRSIEMTQDWEISGGNARELSAAAVADLEAAAPALLEARLGPDQLLAPGSTHAAITDEASVSLSDGRTRLTVQARLTGTTVERDDVNVLAYRALAAAAPEGYGVDASTLQVTLGATSEDTAPLRIEATAAAVPAWDRDVLADDLRGLTLNQATQLLASRMPDSGKPTIELWPNWWARLTGRLPLRATQIEWAAPAVN